MVANDGSVVIVVLFPVLVLLRPASFLFFSALVDSLPTVIPASSFPSRYGDLLGTVVGLFFLCSTRLLSTGISCFFGAVGI